MFKNKINFNNFKNTFYKNFSKKSFSSNNFNSSSAATGFKYLALGVSVAGLSFLTMRNMNRASAYNKALISSEISYNQNVVNMRTRDTLVYFASGLALTGGLTTVMARSRLLTTAMNPLYSLLSLPVTLFFMYKVHTTPSKDSLKPLYFIGFNSCMAFSLVPLSAMIPAVVLRDAGLLTSGLMTGLGLVAYSSKDDAFIGWSGYLGAGLGAMAALSIANIFLNSPVINNIWLYGGLALFTFMTIHDVKEVQIRAKKQEVFDPMGESIRVYMDFINIFIRLALILDSRRKK